MNQDDLAQHEANLAALAEYAERDWRRRVPPRFASAALTDLGGGPVADTIREWLGRTERCPAVNLLLLGPVGCGKTHTAVAVLRTLHLRGCSVAFWPVVDLLEGLRPDGGVKALDVLAADVLVLDDLAVEKPSEWTTERLDLIVNGRWMAERPTIVTTNLTPANLAAALGERAYSRFQQGAVAVRLTGQDRRR